EQLARAARDALRDSAADHAGGLISHLARADHILREVRADRHAYLSDLTPLGLEQRLERFAQAIHHALPAVGHASETPRGPALSRCEELAREGDAHALLEGTPARREAVRMATRLLRWLAVPASLPQGLADAGNRFRDEQAFADWARDLLAGGD